MKRYDHLFEKICDIENLRKAHKNAKKGKGWYKEVQEIDKDPDKYLKQIREMLINHTYRTSEYEVFYKDDGRKKRKIYKLGYRTFYKYTLLRKSTCQEMKKKMTAIRNKVEAGNMMNYSEWCSINSYKGWLKYADSFRLYQAYVVPLLPYADEYYRCNIKPNTKKGRKAA